MRLLTILLALTFCCATPAKASLLIYDGFDYTAGQPLNGQTNIAYSKTWAHAGTATAAPTIASGGFTTPGLKLPAPGSNSAAYDFTKSGTGRLDIPGGVINSGTVFWSGILKVTNVTGITSTSVLPGGGLLLGGFNNSTGGQAGVPTVFQGLFAITKNVANTSEYFIGTGVNGGSRVWATGAPQDASDTPFVVVSYTFNGGSTTDDVVRLWVNPNPADFGAVTAPTHTVQGGTTGADATQIASFIVRNVSGVGSPVVRFDELRIGTDWASVTIPEPGSLGLLLVGCGLTSWRRRVARI